jgi:hypothetical protein
MHLEEKRPLPHVWVETGVDRIAVDAIADDEKRLACRTTEHQIRAALKQFRCPIHHEPIADVVILESDTGTPAFDAYGCCPECEAAARTRLLLHTRQYPAARPLSLAVS